MARHKPKPKRYPAGERMLFDIGRMLTMRGITAPGRWLVAAGISRSTAYAIANGTYGAIKWKQLELICLALNCTPNDLFAWRGDGNDLPVGHELRKLVRGEKPLDIKERLKSLSPEEAEKLLGGE